MQWHPVKLVLNVLRIWGFLFKWFYLSTSELCKLDYGIGTQRLIFSPIIHFEYLLTHRLDSCKDRFLIVIPSTVSLHSPPCHMHHGRTMHKAVRKLGDFLDNGLSPFSARRHCLKRCCLIINDMVVNIINFYLKFKCFNSTIRQDAFKTPSAKWPFCPDLNVLM